MTENEQYGVVGPEGVFEHAPSAIHAEAWARYGGNVDWPIIGHGQSKLAIKRGGEVEVID